MWLKLFGHPRRVQLPDKYQLSFSICSPRRQGHRKPGNWLLNTYLCRAESFPTYSFTHPPSHVLTRTDLKRVRKIFHFVKLQRLQCLPIIAASIFFNVFFTSININQCRIFFCFAMKGLAVFCVYLHCFSSLGSNLETVLKTRSRQMDLSE